MALVGCSTCTRSASARPRSHTVGPMRAARTFADGRLGPTGGSHDVARVRAELFGSLGATGHGHGIDQGGRSSAWRARTRRRSTPTAPTSAARRRSARPEPAARRQHAIAFDPDEDLVLHRRQSLPAPPQRHDLRGLRRRRRESGRAHLLLGRRRLRRRRDGHRGGPDRRSTTPPLPLPVHHRRGAARALRPRPACRSAR